MDLDARLQRLARLRSVGAPVVSVYLDTRWSDEHQRERVRIYLKNKIRQAQRVDVSGALAEDLEWIQAQGDAFVAQADHPDVRAVVLFACHALGLREVLPVRLPFKNAFAVGPTPFLRPLAVIAHEAPATVVVFVDGEHGRLVRLSVQGQAEDVMLQSELPARQARDEWARVTQARYQRHIQAYRDRHFEAVAEGLTELVEHQGVRWIVLAGASRPVSELRASLPHRIAARVLGEVTGDRHDAASVLAERGAELVAQMVDAAELPAVGAVLTEAAKGGQAVAGLTATLEAVNLGAVHRLYLLEAFTAPGRACQSCHALQHGAIGSCRVCGATAESVELGEAIVDRVLATGGAVNTVAVDPLLEHAGGVAAWLRYPISLKEGT